METNLQKKLMENYPVSEEITPFSAESFIIFLRFIREHRAFYRVALKTRREFPLKQGFEPLWEQGVVRHLGFSTHTPAMAHRFQCIQYALDRPGVLCCLPGGGCVQDIKDVLKFYEADKSGKDYSLLEKAVSAKNWGRCVYCNHCAPCPGGIALNLLEEVKVEMSKGGVWKERRMENKKLLIIEDDTDLREGLHFSLTGDGYEVFDVGNKREGLQEIRKGIYDLVLLDCNLPDGTGFELCKEVRRFSTIPIIMLTARDTEMDEIKALDLGVNDYLSKPFSLGVLKARMKRILNERIETTSLRSGNIVIDKSTCKVCKNGDEIVLSKLEYRLLMYLIENKNHVLSKEQILSRIWDSDGKYVDNNTVSVNISRLRTKIENDASNPKFIKTIHGVGYIWKE